MPAHPSSRRLVLDLFWVFVGQEVKVGWELTGVIMDGGHGATARALPGERLGQPMAGSGRGAHRLIVAEINWILTTWSGRNPQGGGAHAVDIHGGRRRRGRRRTSRSGATARVRVGRRARGRDAESGALGKGCERGGQYSD